MAIVITGNGIDMGNNPVSNVAINNDVDVVDRDYADTKTTLAEANNYDLGVGQTWQDVISSRSAGVTYTNSTGKPIYVSLTLTVSSTPSIHLLVDEVIVDRLFTNSTYQPQQQLKAIVPNGSTYKVINNNISAIALWSELR